MKWTHALCLPEREAAALAPLRPWRDVEVLASDDGGSPSGMLWVRGVQWVAEQWALCLRLPGADRYSVLDDGQLLREGTRVPKGWLPEGNWRPLADWLRFELPEPQTVRAAVTPIDLAIERTACEREPNWLQMPLADWACYVTAAPAVRLSRWSFAARHGASVIIRGTPLPPLAGTRYVEEAGIAVPAGWGWRPAVPAVTLAEVFGLGEGEVAVWEPERGWSRVAADDWVRATRSAVRLTAEALAARGGTS